MPRTRSLTWAELKLGVISLAAAALVVVLVFAIGGQGGFFWQRYPLKVCFDSVQGLKTGAVVRVSGKEVGRVTSIEFAGRNVEVVLEVSKEVKPLVTTESTATIGSLSLLGEPIVDVTASDRGTPLEPWSYLTPVAGGGPFGALTSSASTSLSEAGRLLADIRAGRGTVGKLVTDDRLYADVDAFVNSASRVTKQLSAGHGTIAELLRDPSAYQSLKTSLQSLQEATNRLNQGDGSLAQLLRDDKFANTLTSATTHVDAIAGKLERGEGTAGKLLTDRQLYDRLNALTERLGQVTAGLDSGRGTAGRLLHDEKLYDNLNSTVVELRGLISDIRRDPKNFLHLKFSLF